MTLVSPWTLALFVLILGLYYALPRRGQNALLLGASYLIAFAWAWQAAAALLGVTVFNLLWARVLERERRARLWLGIAVNVLALGFFKYSAFFVPEALDLAARFGAPSAGALPVLVPVGLSYYVLQAISYLVDVHQGQVAATGSFRDLALYMAYFPKLLSGPIERAGPFLAQLARPRVVDNDAVARGIALIVLGLVRKAVIADTVAQLIPARVFLRPAAFAAPELLAWLVASAFVVYNDFAGYTCIARGTSSLFGIELSRNFAQPFFAKSFSDLWARWHISLSLWLRDYVYMPLTRVLLRRGHRTTSVAAVVVPPMATMLASAAWHGLSPGFLTWGALSGVLLLVARTVSLRRRGASSPRRLAVPGVLASLGVFLATIATLVPILVGPHRTLAFWAGLFRWTRAEEPDWRSLSAAAALVLVGLWIDWVQHRSNDELAFLRWPRPVQSALLALATIAIFFATQVVIARPFVYQGF